MLESASIVANIHEVVVDAPRFDECTLSTTYEDINKGVSLIAITLATILAIACIKLIGLKSVIASAPSVFGKRTTFVELSQ